MFKYPHSGCYDFEDELNEFHRALNQDADTSVEPSVGNYSSRMEELFSDEEEEHFDLNGALSDDDEEGFVYDGQDAEPRKGYREQMQEILSVNGEGSNDAEDEAVVERSIVHDDRASSEDSKVRVYESEID